MFPDKARLPALHKGAVHCACSDAFPDVVCAIQAMVMRLHEANLTHIQPPDLKALHGQLRRRALGLIARVVIAQGPAEPQQAPGRL